GVYVVASNARDAGLSMQTQANVVVLLAILVGKFVRPEIARLRRVSPELHTVVKIDIARDESLREGEIALLLVGDARVALGTDLILLACVQPDRVDDISARRRLHVCAARTMARLAADAVINILSAPPAVGILRRGVPRCMAAVAFRIANLSDWHFTGLLRASVRR